MIMPSDFAAKWGKTKAQWPARRTRVMVEAGRSFFADSQRAFRAPGWTMARAPRPVPSPAGSVPDPKRIALNSNGDASRRPGDPDAQDQGLTIIARDEEDSLPRCLESVGRASFDEIIVVDTGSTDRTAEIASSFGAKVFRLCLDRRFRGCAE